MVKNSASEKWEYEEHTRVKHVLLEKYLVAWITILGKWNQKICYFDGFAGKGEYIDRTPGSPIRALRAADKLAKYYDKMLFWFIEKDRGNFANLENVLKREEPSIKNLNKMEIIPMNNEFARVIEEIFTYLEEKKHILSPSFFFVDPLGFSGIPFEIIKKILSNPKTEVFFTFMIRDINRFIKLPRLRKTFTILFGTDEWKEIIKLPNREKALIELYRRQLHEVANIKYSIQFRVCENTRLKTLYYLIHANNNFTGHSIMKDVMFKQSAVFAYLGPKYTFEQTQMRLFDINDIGQLKKYLLEKFKYETLIYNEVQERACHPWNEEPPYIDKHYRQALKELEKERKIKVERVTSKTTRGLRGKDRISFPIDNPIQTSMLNMKPKSILKIPKIRIRFKKYKLLDGTKKTLVWKVSDGSIITRFDKTPIPTRKTDIVCPHFLELKWAYGCPFDCAWCYLKGTFRFRPEGTSPVIKSYEKIKLHVERFLEEVKEPEILNTGEIADSLMNENANIPFSRFIIPLFEKQGHHKVLFLTKSSNVKNLLEICPHDHVIVSFSLNAIPVAERWERAPHVLKRIEAAKKILDAGYEVRIRIDPMVPVKNWQKYYLQLIEIIFKNFSPERITVGSLRGLQSTINGCTDKTWVRYLKESSNWGKKIDFRTRYAMYSIIIQELKTTYNFDRVSLCKESIKMWEVLKMDYKAIKCNCVW